MSSGPHGPIFCKSYWESQVFIYIFKIWKLQFCRVWRGVWLQSLQMNFTATRVQLLILGGFQLQSLQINFTAPSSTPDLGGGKQTWQFVGIYLPDHVFTHGQLYVAFSRVTDPSVLAVCLNNPDGFTRNIVFQEVLWLYAHFVQNHEISVPPLVIPCEARVGH